MFLIPETGGIFMGCSGILLNGILLPILAYYLIFSADIVKSSFEEDSGDPTRNIVIGYYFTIVIIFTAITFLKLWASISLLDGTMKVSTFVIQCS